MTGSEHEHGHHQPHVVAVAHAAHQRRVARVLGRQRWTGARRRAVGLVRLRFLRRVLWGLVIFASIATVAVVGLWWRLSGGPIELNLATPWLKAAIEENFGGNHSVAVGGTQLERDEKGRTSLRLRDIIVRDSDGTVVASAPKAEVGLSGRSLLVGRLRAQSLNLVGAEMSIRIETDGRLTVFAGADKRPIATAAPGIGPPRASAPDSNATPQAALQAGFQDFAGIMARLDAVGESGLDGHDLRELGLKNGNLVVDDRRNGKRWTFDGINASLTRPRQGGVIFRLESDNTERPWVLSAAMRPLTEGMTALPPAPSNCRNFEKIARMPFRFSSMASSVRTRRLSSFPDGSPTRVVPPPIRAIGRCPVCWSQYSIMIGKSEPTCSEDAVQSNPI